MTQNTLYVTQQGAQLCRCANRLAVRKGGAILQEIPLETLRQVIVCGNVQITTQAMQTLLRRGVDLVLLTLRGELYGRIDSLAGAASQLQHDQFQRARNAAVALQISRAIVRAKIHNQHVLLARRLADIPDLQPAVDQLRALQRRVEAFERVESLRGLEGSAAGVYFKAFARCLKKPLGFQRRAKRPPTDPVNILLSFGYTLLHKDMIAALRIVGLDPFLGFFHERRAGHPALASDLIEEFRPVIVDSLVLALLNRRQLAEKHFLRRGPKQIELRPEGLRLFLAAYSQRIHSRILHPSSGEQAAYLRCLELQARNLARFLQGKTEAYEPFLMK